MPCERLSTASPNSFWPMLLLSSVSFTRFVISSVLKSDERADSCEMSYGMMLAAAGVDVDVGVGVDGVLFTDEEDFMSGDDDM